MIKQAPAARIRAILNRLYPGQISDNVTFILPAQPAAGNAMRIVLSRQYGFGSLMLWLVYFMGLFLVYILGSWLPTLVKAVGMTVSQAAIMTAIYQAGGTLGSLFAGWLMDRINPHRALGIIYAVGGLFTMAMGYAAGSFALLCMLAFISGACLNGANTGMNALSARYYPTQARATGSSWMHGVGRIGAILSAFAGAEMMALNLPFESVFFDPRHPGSPHRRRPGGEGHLCGRSSSRRFNFPRVCARSVIAASGPRCNRRIAPPSAANKENLFHIFLKRKNARNNLDDSGRRYPALTFSTKRKRNYR